MLVISIKYALLCFIVYHDATGMYCARQFLFFIHTALNTFCFHWAVQRKHFKRVSGTQSIDVSTNIAFESAWSLRSCIFVVQRRNNVCISYMWKLYVLNYFVIIFFFFEKLNQDIAKYVKYMYESGYCKIFLNYIRKNVYCYLSCYRHYYSSIYYYIIKKQNYRAVLLWW